MAVRYAPELASLLFSFADRTAIFLPVGNYPELAALSEAELQALRLGFGGSALCLDAVGPLLSLLTLSQIESPSKLNL